MKKTLILLTAVLGLLCSNRAAAQDGTAVSLWADAQHPTDNPKALQEGMMAVFPAPADQRTGRAVIICPGGGYTHHAMDHEGFDWIPFFHSQGVAVAVLKYTLPHGNRTLPERDAEQAMRIMKQRAAEWGFNPDSIGVMGFSAGGHFAATLTTTKNASVRPAFSILFYPVISMQKELTHLGSHHALLTDTASVETENAYSNEMRVDGNTPPTIIFHSNDDRTVSPMNSVAFYSAMLKAERQCALHFYPTGRHGWGFRTTFTYHDQMTNELAHWLNTALQTTDIKTAAKR